MITPAIKDKVLSSLLSSDKTIIQIEFDRLEQWFDVEQKFVIIILKQFSKLGLIDLIYYEGKDIAIISLNAEIYDFVLHGGFVGQEELLRANLES